MKKTKIIYLGTPEFAVPALNMLIASGYKPTAVITEPDRPKGRNGVLTPPPVKIVAEENHITVFQPEKIEKLKLEIESLKPSLLVVCAYGQIIPKDILEIPKFGALNIHPSLLPKYRGASPLQATILAGDKETGVTIMKIDEKMDHGAIVASTKFQITRLALGSPRRTNSKITYLELTEKLADLGSKLLIQTLPDYLAKKIKPTPQNHNEATFTKLLKKEDGLIDWTKRPEEIERQIRAYYPWPGSYFVIAEKRFIIHSAHAENNKLIIDQIQPEGKKSISSQEFIRGYSYVLTKLPNFVKI